MFQPSAKTQAQQNASAGYIRLATGLLAIAAVFALPLLFHKTDGSPEDWFPVAAVVGVILGGMLVFSGGRAIYDAQPIPNDPIRAPAPLRLTQDEPWRRPTSLRFLEKLKKQISAIETEVRQDYERAVQAYERLPYCSGRIEYDKHKQTLEFAARDIADAQDRRLPVLRQRVEKIFAGDVNAEILDLQEKIRKLQRNKEEGARSLQELEIPCAINHKTDDEVEHCRRERESQKQSHRQNIHNIDFEIIENETHLGELRGFDFQRLYRDLGLTGPPGLLNLDTVHLQDIKTKAELINTIPQVGPKPDPPSAARRSRDEEDIGRIVSTIDSIDGLKKAWTQKKQNSPPEQHELIDRLFRKAIDARLEKL